MDSQDRDIDYLLRDGLHPVQDYLRAILIVLLRVEGRLSSASSAPPRRRRKGGGAAGSSARRAAG
jgi:hypothetical protein